VDAGQSDEDFLAFPPLNTPDVFWEEVNSTIDTWLLVDWL
jgi:hypothetical protein